MTGKTHLVFGLVSGGLVGLSLYQPEWLTLAGFTFCSAFGSLSPDVDNPKSIISKPIKLLSKAINKMFGHRGLLHSPVYCIFLYFLGAFLLKRYNLHNFFPLLYGFLFGYVGHLFLDLLTSGGISVFYPFSRKRYRILKIKTGGVSEGIAIAIVGLIILFGLILMKFIDFAGFSEFVLSTFHFS